MFRPAHILITCLLAVSLGVFSGCGQGAPTAMVAPTSAMSVGPAVQRAVKQSVTAQAQVRPQKEGHAQIRIRLQLPPRPASFATQAVDVSKLVRVQGELYGLGISEVIHPDQANGNGELVIPANGQVDLTFSQVPYGKGRVLSLLFSEATGFIDSGLIATAFDLSSATAEVEVSFRTVPVAWITRGLLNRYPELFGRVSVLQLQTLVDQIIQRTGSAPNYQYVISPWRIDPLPIIDDLIANGGNVSALNTSDSRYVLDTMAVTVTVEGLVADDQIDLRVADMTSPQLRVGNGAHVIDHIQRHFDNLDRLQGLWPLVVSISEGAGTIYEDVPSGITLIDNGQAMQERSVTVTPMRPELESLSSNVGKAGDTIFLNGQYFHANLVGNVVKFGEIAVPAADVTVLSAERLAVKVPLGVTGNVQVSVSVGTRTSGIQNFNILSPEQTGAYLAFTSDRSGEAQIYTMAEDGQHQTAITHMGANVNPAISPDGNKMAFFSNRDSQEGYYQLFVMDRDGSNQTRINHTLVIDPQMTPSWSPDGNQLVFFASPDGWSWDIYAIDANGANLRLLTPTSEGEIMPQWSPDGSRIAFIQGEGLSTMASDGSNRQQLLDFSEGFPENRTYPVWDPSGQYIYMVVAEHNSQTGFREDFDVYRMGLDGSPPVNLTASSESDEGLDDSQFFRWGLSVSSDGEKIAFLSQRDGNNEIYAMDRNGNNPQRLTTDLATDFNVSWWRPVQQPLVSNLSSASGVTHDIITLYGSGFSPIEAQNVVKFGTIEVPATDVTYISPNQLSVKVPHGNTGNVPVTVRIYNKVSNSLIFNHTLPTHPYLAFSSDRSGSFQIYTMNEDGSEQIALTHQGENLGASISPNGNQIAFFSNRNGLFELFLMNRDGTAQRSISADYPSLQCPYGFFAGSEHHPYSEPGCIPSWSPDGNKLVFFANNGTVNDLYTIHADGSQLQQLTPGITDIELTPSWSPDGSRIAFSKNGSLYSFAADGSDEQLIYEPAYDPIQPSAYARAVLPIWSPDGQQVYFTAEGEMQKSDIYRVDINGQNVRNLTDGINANDGQIGFPLGMATWFGLSLASDGSELAFLSQRDAVELYKMGVDGSNPVRLTNNMAHDVNVSWWRPGSGTENE